MSGDSGRNLEDGECKNSHPLWFGMAETGQRLFDQRPSIVTIGPAGENRSRIASLIHAGGSGAGQGGFGGVFGSKNLKAIAVIGTGSIKVADPKAVRDARDWFEARFPMSGQRGPGRNFTPGVSGCLGCNRVVTPGARFTDSIPTAAPK